jgi:hypothetical protein
LGQRNGLKNPWAGEEDVFLVHPQNDLNCLILNWCTGGCWFIPAPALEERMVIATTTAARTASDGVPTGTANGSPRQLRAPVA